MNGYVTDTGTRSTDIAVGLFPDLSDDVTVKILRDDRAQSISGGKYNITTNSMMQQVYPSGAPLDYGDISVELSTNTLYLSHPFDYYIIQQHHIYHYNTFNKDLKLLINLPSTKAPIEHATIDTIHNILFFVQKTDSTSIEPTAYKYYIDTDDLVEFTLTEVNEVIFSEYYDGNDMLYLLTYIESDDPLYNGYRMVLKDLSGLKGDQIVYMSSSSNNYLQYRPYIAVKDGQYLHFLGVDEEGHHEMEAHWCFDFVEGVLYTNLNCGLCFYDDKYVPIVNYCGYLDTDGTQHDISFPTGTPLTDEWSYLYAVSLNGSSLYKIVNRGSNEVGWQDCTDSVSSKWKTFFSYVKSKTFHLGHTQCLIGASANDESNESLYEVVFNGYDLYTPDTIKILYKERKRIKVGWVKVFDRLIKKDEIVVNGTQLNYADYDELYKIVNRKYDMMNTNVLYYNEDTLSYKWRVIIAGWIGDENNKPRRII